jgi:hypothetical protein
VIVNCPIDYLEVGDCVLVMSREHKFLARGTFKGVSKATDLVALVKIDDFNTTRIDIKSCIGSITPNNQGLEIGEISQFVESELFKIVNAEE